MHDCGSSQMGNKSSFNLSSLESAKLTLVVIDSVHMAVGQEYEIYPYGLKDSERNSKDGCVYAGSLQYENNLRINDILLPETEKGVGQKHFMIFHNQNATEKGSYYIKDLGNGMGTFIRLQHALDIQDNFIVSLGSSHLKINFDNESVILQFIDGPRSQEKL